MEFEGTQGNWVMKSEAGSLFITSNQYGAICKIPHSVGKLEHEANALLISKAPEMLEMIDKLCEELEFHQVSLSKAKEGRELIKQATEL